VEISKTADQALVLLLCLADRGTQTPIELARATGLNRTVVHRLLATLHGRGFVVKRGDRFGPGPVLLRLAGQFEPALRAVARGVMAELSDRLGETLVLAVREDAQVVIVEQVVAAGHLVRVQYELGYRHAITRGASGLALLAFLPAADTDAILAETADAAQLRRRLADVRAVGYATTHDELRAGAWGLAAPVRDGDGAAIASLSAVVPTTRITGIDYAGPVLEAADRIGRQLTATAPADGH
jgi:DNA-binding IclR family transcriptional regulator